MPPLSNSSLLRTQGRSGSGRLHQPRVSGMTSSSSASSNSNNNNAERSREREQQQQQRDREQHELDEQMLKDGMPALLLQLHSGKCIYIIMVKNFQVQFQAFLEIMGF